MKPTYHDIPAVMNGGQITEKLLTWFAENRRNLPWRQTQDPYGIWISEIMLQQTRVDTVIPYYQRFLERFPTVERLADAPLEDVLKAWEGLGYYSRARNMHKAAQAIITDHGGIFPNEYMAVRALPGIGDYTAGAIMSIAFGQPFPAVDGNVLRVLARLCRDDGDIMRPETKARFSAWVQALMPTVLTPGNPCGNLTQALMELGAMVCMPDAPHCGQCPLEPLCAARALGLQDRFPYRSPKAPPVPMPVDVHLVAASGGFWVHRRPAKGMLAGLYTFPLIMGETVGMPLPGLVKLQDLGKATHVFTHRVWHMHGMLWRSEIDSPPLPPVGMAFEPFEVQHISTPKAISELPFPSAMRHWREKILRE